MPAKFKMFTAIFVICMTVSLMAYSSASSSYAETIPPPDGYIEIYTPQDLSDMRNNLSGQYILMANIDLTSFTAAGDGWEPIGTLADPFTGVLDGNGYSVTGMRIYKSYTNSTSFVGGLFGYGKGMLVQNLNLSGSIDVTVARADRYAYLGGLVGHANAIGVSNCTTNLTMKGRAAKVVAGGLVGMAVIYRDDDAEMIQIEDSLAQGTLFGSGKSFYLGGLVGSAEKAAIGTSASQMGIQGFSTSTESASAAAGIVGVADDYYIEDCLNQGNITGDASYLFSTGQQAVKLAGITTGRDEQCTVYIYGPTAYVGLCENTGNLSIKRGKDAFAAGIVCDVVNGEVFGCNNSGAVVANGSQGGDAAGVVINVENTTVYGCYNTGEISATFSAAGVAVNNIWGQIWECYNTGAITSYSETDQGYAGGLVANNQDWVEDCYNVGYVKGYCAAGIAAINAADGIIDYCYNLGGVKSKGGSFGGIAGISRGVVGDAYYLENCATGVGIGSGGTNLSVRITPANMKTQATYAGFYFDDGTVDAVWEMSPESGLPRLIALDEVYADSLTVVIQPARRYYLVGDAINTGGGLLKVGFSDGTSTYIEDRFVAGAYATTAGTRNITLNYAGKAATYPVNFSTVTADAISGARIQVRWTPVAGATSYKIYRSTSASGTYALLYTASSTTKSYVNTGRTMGSTYYYKVLPMFGTRSGTISTYKAARCIPETPTGITIQLCKKPYFPIDANLVRWAWSTSNAVPLGYEVYCSNTINGTFVKLGTVPFNLSRSMEYAHSGLTSGTTYYYKVRAYTKTATGTVVYGNFSDAVGVMY